MLSSLHIKNVAIISQLSIDFSNGFSVLTGETGAGKSILIDSINFLLGNKIQKDFIRTGSNEAKVSALFTDIPYHTINEINELGTFVENGEIYLERNISIDGKQKAFCNGQAVSQSLLKNISHLLINIYGQNGQQKLLQKSIHIHYLDSFAQNNNQLAEYQKIYREYCLIKKELESINRDTSTSLRLQEMLNYQINEIQSSHLKIGEEKKLNNELNELTNIEKIKIQTTAIWNYLYGGEKVNVVQMIERCIQNLRQLSQFIPDANDKIKILEDFKYQIIDIADWSQAKANISVDNPTEKIDQIQGRLDLIYKLKKKYGPDEEAVLDFCKQCITQLDSLQNVDDKLEKLSKELLKKEKELTKLAETLTISRQHAAQKMEKSIITTLQYLDMPTIDFKVAISQCGFNEFGCDDVIFQLSSNIGEPLKDLSQIASGGELSRIMLAISTVLSDADSVNTIIFDEIDTGISGKTSRKIGLKLKELSTIQQIICVTHSAQVASLAHNHYKVQKAQNDRHTETVVSMLSMEERIEEIARILGGLYVTDNQRKVAEEMISKCES